MCWIQTRLPHLLRPGSQLRLQEPRHQGIPLKDQIVKGLVEGEREGYRRYLLVTIFFNHRHTDLERSI